MFDNLHEGEDRKSSVEKLWMDIEEEVRKFYTELYSKNFHYSEQENKAEFEQIINNRIEGEKNFCVKVVMAVEKLHQTSNDVVVLFDIDNTLLDVSQDGTNKTVFRPSALALLQTISDSCKIGFLTSRAELGSQMKHELEPISDYIDPSLLISTRNALQFGMDQSYYNEFKDTAFALEIGAADYEKIHVYRNLIQQTPSREYLVVDDLNYPDTLGDNGVSLKKNEKFWLE